MRLKYYYLIIYICTVKLIDSVWKTVKSNFNDWVEKDNICLKKWIINN